MSRDVFISHSKYDVKIAEDICALLELEGVTCWMAPRDVPPGANWPLTLANALDSSKAIILILSEKANESQTVPGEILHAFNQQKTIFPIRVEKNVEPGKELRIFISRAQFFDAFDPPLKTKIRQLAQGIKGMLKAEEPPFDQEAAVKTRKPSAEIPKPIQIGDLTGGPGEKEALSENAETPPEIPPKPPREENFRPIAVSAFAIALIAALTVLIRMRTPDPKPVPKPVIIDPGPVIPVNPAPAPQIQAPVDTPTTAVKPKNTPAELIDVRVRSEPTSDAGIKKVVGECIFNHKPVFKYDNNTNCMIYYFSNIKMKAIGDANWRKLIKNVSITPLDGNKVEVKFCFDYMVPNFAIERRSSVVFFSVLETEE